MLEDLGTKYVGMKAFVSVALGFLVSEQRLQLKCTDLGSILVLILRRCQYLSPRHPEQSLGALLLFSSDLLMFKVCSNYCLGL